MELAFLAGGIDAPGYFLRDVGFDYNVAHFYDTAGFLRAPLARIHGEELAQHLRIGPDEGNLLSVEYQTWPSVDGVISGPPCPPWSSIGPQLGEADERSKVSEVVTAIIIDQGWKGMAFFCTEMVLGQDHARLSKPSNVGTVTSYYKDWLGELACKAPMFLISCFVLDARDYMLPHHRERLYTVGLHRKFSTTPLPQPPSLPRVPVGEAWREVLHAGLTHDREDFLTPQQRDNVQFAKAMVLRRGSWVNPVCVSADRNPRLPFGCMLRVSDGCSSTLRTGDELLWLMDLHTDGSCTLSRAIHPLERFALQGFDCSYFGDHLTKKETRV